MVEYKTTTPTTKNKILQKSNSPLFLKSIYPPQLQILSYEGNAFLLVEVIIDPDDLGVIDFCFSFSLSVCVPKNYFNQCGCGLDSLLNNKSYLPTITFTNPTVGDFVFQLSNGSLLWVNAVAKASVPNNSLSLIPNNNPSIENIVRPLGIDPYNVHTYVTRDKYLKSDIQQSYAWGF